MYTYGTNLQQTQQDLQQAQQPAASSLTTTPSPTPVQQDYQSGGASDFLNSGAQGIAKSIGDFFSTNPIGKAVSNLFSPIAKSGVGTAIGNVLSVPQRAAFSVATAPFSTKQNPAPNFFDFSQVPGSQLSQYALGNKSNFISELGASLLDPLMLLSGPEDGAKVALSTGKEANLTKEGVSALQDLAQAQHGTTDLAKVEELTKGKGVDLLKQQLVKANETTNPQYFDRGGIKFAGQTVVPQDALDALGHAVTNNPVVNTVKDNYLTQAFRSLVDRHFTNLGNLSDEELKALDGVNRAKFVAIQKMQDLVHNVFGGLSNEELSQFRDAAKFGLPTITDAGRLNRSELVGKSVEELQHLAPNLSPKTIQAYHTYINKYLPELEDLATKNFKFNKDLAPDNYLHEMKTDRLSLRQKFGSTSPQVRQINKSGSMKQAVVSAGQDEASLAAKGFETNPAITTGHMAQERYLADEINNHIDNIVQKFGTKVDPKTLLKSPEAQDWLVKNGITKPTLKDAIRYYKEQGHGIFQPQGNLRFYKGMDSKEIKVSNRVPTYAVSAPLAGKLNELRAGNNFKLGYWSRLAKFTSQKLIRLQFAFPQFAVVHGLWHLAFNSFLESGGKALTNLGAVGDTLNDLTHNTPFLKLLKENGALPHHLDETRGTVEDLIRKAAGGDSTKSDFLHSMWKFSNPLGDKYIANTALKHEDDFLRTLSIRNNIQTKGMSLQEAIQRSNKFMVDYNNLTDTERNWVRLIAPFYAWTKGNIGAQVSAAIETPWRQLVPQKVLDVLNQEFSGHTRAANDPGHQSDLDMGPSGTGKEVYTEVPIGTRDIQGVSNNPGSFATNRFGQVAKNISIGATGTDFGFPVTNSNSPTPEALQRITAIANNSIPSDATDIINGASGNPNELLNLESKFGVYLDPAQYTSASPLTLRQKLLGSAGLRTSEVTPSATKNSYQNYYQGKLMKSLRKKGIY